MTTLPVPTFLQKSGFIVFLTSILFIASFYGQLRAQRSAATAQACGTTFAGRWRLPNNPAARWNIRVTGSSAQSDYQGQRVVNGTINGDRFSGQWHEVAIDHGQQVKSGSFVAILIPSERKIKVTFYVGRTQFDYAEWICGTRTTPTPAPTHVPTPTGVHTPPPSPTPTPSPSPNAMWVRDDHDTDNFETFDMLDSVEQQKVLVQRGPRLPKAYTASDLSMRVLAKGGWPIILEYGLVADNPAILSIQVADRRPFLVRLPPSPRNQMNLHVPRIGRDETHVAKVRIKTAADTDEFRLYGFGMGEKAIAALGRLNSDLSRLELAMNNSAPDFSGSNLLALLSPQTGSSIRINVSLPHSLKVKQRPEQKIVFSYTSNSDFSAGRWEWWRVRGLDWEKVWNEKTGRISRNQTGSNDWNGIITSAKLVSPGFHALNLVAWQRAGEENEWVAARTDPALEVIE